MIFGKDSAFKQEGEKMEKFFQQWEQSALHIPQPKVTQTEEAHKVAREKHEANTSAYHLTEAQEEIELLAKKLPSEFQDQLDQIARHVEDAQQL